MNNLLLNNNNKTINPNIQKIKDMQKIKEYEKINQIEITKDNIKDLILKPIKLTKNNQDYSNILKTKQQEYKNVENYWKGRTNQPYKNILKDEDYSKTIKDEKDLIVHRVTANDKLGVKEKYNEIKKNIENHNKELGVIYSTSEEAQHKKKFEYAHRYRDKKKYNPSSFNDMKKAKVEEVEAEKVISIDKDNILSQLVSNGIFNEDELKMFTS